MPVEQVIRFAHLSINDLAAGHGPDTWAARLAAMQEFAKKHGFESTEAALEKAWSDPDA